MSLHPIHVPRLADRPASIRTHGSGFTSAFRIAKEFSSFLSTLPDFRNPPSARVLSLEDQTLSRRLHNRNYAWLAYGNERTDLIVDLTA